VEDSKENRDKYNRFRCDLITILLNINRAVSMPLAVGMDKGYDSIYETRDRIISTISQIGLNPFKHGTIMHETSDDIILPEIIKIKRCIYEGFRMSLCKKRDVYTNECGVVITPTNATSEYILAINPMLRNSGGVNIVIPSYVCELDGYVNPDGLN
jgi:hypothetical protein